MSMTIAQSASRQLIAGFIY